MNTPANVAAIVRLVRTAPAHQAPRKVYLVRPLVFLVLTAALALAPFVLPRIAGE
jgi:hypothetical protein